MLNPSGNASTSDQRLQACFRAWLSQTLPADAAVTVISKGDVALLPEYGCHFPMTPHSHSDNSEALIRELEEQREGGAQFLAIPHTAFWWFDHYGEFGRYIHRCYQVVRHAPDTGVVYDLRTLQKAKPAADATPTVLMHHSFVSFAKFTGNHNSVWRFYNYLKQSPDYHVEIAFSRESRWGPDNLWHPLQDQVLPSWHCVRPDIIFNVNWKLLSAHERDHSPVPLVWRMATSFHADPRVESYQYLRHRAIRICISEDVAEAIRGTGQVNGPIFVVENAVELDRLPPPRATSERDLDLFIGAHKNPDLGRQLENRLSRPGRQIKILTDAVRRPEYLDWINRARFAVLLPKAMEGFYNPPLEALALGTLPVVPLVQGNRHFTQTMGCLCTAYELEAIVTGAETALGWSAVEVSERLADGQRYVSDHSVEKERRAFFEILDNVRQIW